ncbi:MAG: hypothetical protein LDLANPLL_02348 [Turneriella sp.]|nr:hypothetical protein [Turneriella sp.]
MFKRGKPIAEDTPKVLAKRPPWIEKVAIPASILQAPFEEPEWKSRLAEKIKSLRENNSSTEPVTVRASTKNQNFAFHLGPLDEEAPFSAKIPSPTAQSHTPTAPSENFENGQMESLEYKYVSEKAAPKVEALSYELSHSTIAYGGGDDFDIERLFEDAAIVAPTAWSAPEEIIEALDVEEASLAVEKNRVEDKSLLEEIQEEIEEEIENAHNALQIEPKQSLKKPEDTPKKGFPVVERASITPMLSVNKQREFSFPILKTQKRALEFTNPSEAQSVIEKLEETLEQFSIEGHVVGIQRGPIITRYELKMAAGIKVSRILALTDELAMALEAMRVRIEAPIPGRSTVGIEIPNRERVKVLLGDILNDTGFREFGGQLPLPLGRDIAGNLLLEDLTRMPHLLIAGATGSGKSVAVNSFISSLILNKTPEEVRFLLVDPKLVELSAYNDIPHLLHPVITEPNKAILALNWAVEEMERRYEDLADMRARDIRSFNEKVKAQKPRSDAESYPPMPYIVILIDELGDLMMVAGKEVESSIIRLAQKARAVGIHLILATQRPSVDVITALIKANCPARIALQVAQKTDSRTILDGNGAEQLLGQGDMLFRHPSKAQLIRAQVPLIEDNEVEAVVEFAKKMAKPIYITLEDPKGKLGELDEGDEELFDEAWQIILESQKASASYLQRRLRIGYNKAARLIEAFEARGMVGPQIGSKPREILGS